MFPILVGRGQRSVLPPCPRQFLVLPSCPEYASQHRSFPLPIPLVEAVAPHLYGCFYFFPNPFSPFLWSHGILSLPPGLLASVLPLPSRTPGPTTPIGPASCPSVSLWGCPCVAISPPPVLLTACPCLASFSSFLGRCMRCSSSCTMHPVCGHISPCTPLLLPT